MLSTWLPELVRFVAALEQTQHELAALFVAKQSALDRFAADELVTLSAREEELTKRLQGVVAKRGSLLESARLGGYAAGSLCDVAGAIGKQVGDARIRTALESLQTRIRQAQVRTAELQRQSWVHWIVSHRCHQHYSALLELIAHGGNPAPTYGDRNPGSSGGALLDAAA